MTTTVTLGIILIKVLVDFSLKVKQRLVVWFKHVITGALITSFFHAGIGGSKIFAQSCVVLMDQVISHGKCDGFDLR